MQQGLFSQINSTSKSKFLLSTICYVILPHYLFLLHQSLTHAALSFTFPSLTAFAALRAPLRAGAPWSRLWWHRLFNLLSASLLLLLLNLNQPPIKHNPHSPQLFINPLLLTNILQQHPNQIIISLFIVLVEVLVSLTQVLDHQVQLLQLDLVVQAVGLDLLVDLFDPDGVDVDLGLDL